MIPLRLTQRGRTQTPEHQLMCSFPIPLERPRTPITHSSGNPPFTVILFFRNGTPGVCIPFGAKQGIAPSGASRSAGGTPASKAAAKSRTRGDPRLQGQRVCYAQRHRPKTPSRLKRERESHREKHQEKIQDLHMAWFWRVATRGFKFLAAVGQDLHVQLHAERKALTEAHDSNRTEHQQLLACQQLTGTGRAYDL